MRPGHTYYKNKTIQNSIGPEITGLLDRKQSIKEPAVYSESSPSLNRLQNKVMQVLIYARLITTLTPSWAKTSFSPGKQLYYLMIGSTIHTYVLGKLY